MMALLVRSELWPDHSALRAVPIEKVAKLMWFHHQASELVIWSDGRRVGHLKLEPKVGVDGDARTLEFSGNLQVRLPGSPRHRISWDGKVTFDENFHPDGLTLGLDMKDVSNDRAEIRVTRVDNRAHFRVLNVQGIELESSEYSLDERGLKKLLAQVDLDPSLIDAMRSPATAAPTVTAQESSLVVHHERTKTYLTEVRQGGQTLLEAHVNELGQVIRVKIGRAHV